MACSVARTAGLVADPWTLLVLRDLFLGVTRFEQFRRDLGVATNVLTDRLDRIVEAGLVDREPYQDHPVRHEYRLTESGTDLYGALAALLAWGDQHLAPDGPPMLLHHTTCDHATTPVVACHHCGTALTAADVRATPGPGAATTQGTAVITGLLADRA